MAVAQFSWLPNDARPFLDWNGKRGFVPKCAVSGHAMYMSRHGTQGIHKLPTDAIRQFFCSDLQHTIDDDLLPSNQSITPQPIYTLRCDCEHRVGSSRNDPSSEVSRLHSYLPTLYGMGYPLFGVGSLLILPLIINITP